MFLQDKMEARLRGWRSKSLSWAGRCTLIKSIAQALPTYSMSTFELPNKVCDKLDAQTRRFWWNPRNQNGRYLARKAWDYLCQPKKNGGLGFKHTKDFNEALIAKLTWMVVSNRDSLCMRCLRSKYKVRHNWLRSEETAKNAFQIWRAIEKARGLIRRGTCYQVGDGKSIDVCISLKVSIPITRLINPRTFM